MREGGRERKESAIALLLEMIDDAHIDFVTYTSIVASRTMMGKDRGLNEVLVRIDGLGGEKELAKLSIHLIYFKGDFF